MARLCNFLILAGSLVSCSSDDLFVSDPFMLTFNQSPVEIQSVCDGEQARLKASLDAVAGIAAETVNFDNTIGVIESAITMLNNRMNPVTFLKYISDGEAVRDAADACEQAVQQMFVDIFVREDLYRAVKAVKDSQISLDGDSAFLLDEYITYFQRNGLGLSAENRKAFIEKKKRLVTLESDFSKNLVEWADSLAVSTAELEGLSDGYKNSLKTDAAGQFLITLDYPHFYPFMENAKSVTARKALEEKFFRRGGMQNTALLDEAIQIRRELAALMGFENHAAFVLTRRMAKDPGQVMTFLNRLKDKLIPKGQADLAQLQILKNAETGTTEPLRSYDWRYYDTQLKKDKYQVDQELIRQYFPLETVVSGMFEIYQRLLGVSFFEVMDAPVWHPSVRLYHVLRNDRVVAQFYMDLFPRDGKYGHAAAFTLVSGFAKADGSYQIPVSSIVANFSPPVVSGASGSSAGEGTPSLLAHQEVETLFHEFGHIMHQVLTTARFASYSGTSVKNDFVEAPSQMLENWVWFKESLSKLSGHYQTKEKLPETLLTKLIEAKGVNSGLRYLRQLSFGLIDMTYHTQVGIDSTEVYRRLSEEVMLIPIPDGTYPQASFGHLMGGYDAGYYGYLWSEVYAQDMFTRFETEGLMNPKTGKDYLQWILEPGGLKDPFALIRGFLGREPNEAAFLKSLGI